MKRRVLLFFLCYNIFVSYGQDALNQINKDGKKHGKWIVWLDDLWSQLKDSNNATYYRYTYFDNGFELPVLARCGNKNWKLEHTPSNNPPTSIGKIKLLDGDYKWINTKGQIKSVHTFNKGELVFHKFFLKSGKAYDYFDYTKTWKGQPHSFLMCKHYKNGDNKYWYMRQYTSINGQNSWAIYPVVEP